MQRGMRRIYRLAHHERPPRASYKYFVTGRPVISFIHSPFGVYQLHQPPSNMTSKVIFVLAAAVLAVCNGGAIPLGAPAPFAVPAGHFPAPVPVPLTKVGDYDPHPQYTYAYDVQDALTGDSKSQHETRDGDVVRGSYSLIEADGTRRVVEYTADPINGFNAVVHREPATFVKPVVKVAPAPLAYHL